VIEIRLLGRFSVRRAGEEISPGAFGGRLVRALVRLLVTRRGEFVSHDVLAEALWPGRLPVDPRANLQVLVNRARRALGDPSLILTGPAGYSFAAGNECVVDAECFLAWVAAGRDRLAAGHAGAALREFRQALDGWGEPLPEDAYEDWAQEYRTILARAHLEALEEGASAALAVRDPVQAAAFAEQAVMREPLRESAYLLLARSLLGSGDQAGALRVLDALRRRLVEELGLDPSAGVRELERQILRGDPLGPVTARPAVVASSPPFDELVFVGRDEELEAAVGALAGPDPGVVLVSGGPGMGKTRLLAEVAGRAEVAVLAARAFLPERDEAWGLARSLLREAVSLDLDAARALPNRAAEALADILPELEELRPIASGTVDAESRRVLAFQASVGVISGVAAKGALLLVDDLQWADATSLGLLGLVASRVPGLGAVLAYRPEEILPDSPVASFLRGLPIHPGRVVTVMIGPLPAAAISRLVAGDDVVDAIVEESDGTPLAVAEVLRTLVAEGALEPDLEGRWRARRDDSAATARTVARSGQRRSIAARAARQPPRRRETLSLLALLGREVPARVLTSALAAPPTPVLDDLDALTRAGLARLGEGGWAPAHDLVGETVADGLEQGERGRLHQVLAQALAAEGGDPAEIGRHLTGAGDRAAAAAAYADAARDRLARFAGDEVATLANAGLGLDPEPPVRSALLAARAEGRAIAGDLAGARADLHAAVATLAPGPDRARVLSRIATLTMGEDLAQAAEAATAALMEAGSDPATRAEALAVAAIVDVHTSRFDRAETRSAEALVLFEGLGDAGGLARVLDARAARAIIQGNLAEAAHLFDQAARLYLDAGKPLLAGTPRLLRGWALEFMGRWEEALEDIQEALELERTLGQSEGEAFCLQARGETLASLGRVAEAREDARTAVTSLREFGNRMWLAKSLQALGQVEEAAGNLEAAEAAMREAVEVAAGFPLSRSLAAARLASVLVARGDLDSAQEYAQRAVMEGVPLVCYEARLVLGQIAVLRGDPEAQDLVADALAQADAGGYVDSPARRWLEKAGLKAGPPGGAAAAGRRQRRTFMFTDIVRSTNLVEAVGDEAWEHLMRWHDETLRSLFRSHGGDEINRIGDGFFVAFEEAEPAAGCAVAIQRALARHRLEHGFSPEVRIGLHEAEATRKGRDYQGKGIHVAARIAALAGGGEIIASRPLVSQLQGLALSDPRSVKLRGLSEPIEVISISWH